MSAGRHSAGVAVVTGGADGIGRATAERLGEMGYAVAILDVRPKAAEDTARALGESGVRALPVGCDVSSASDVESAIQRVVAELGTPTVLVNNAGVTGPSERLEDARLSEWQRVLGVNLTGVFLCTQAVGRHMLRNGSGSIVNVASVAGVAPQTMRPAYGATKAAVIRFTEMVALEWGPRGIRCNCISPGPIRTPMTEATYAHADLFEERRRLVPLRRIGDPSDIARVVAFLVSEGSAFVTGVNVVVDGGLVLTMSTHVPRMFEGKVVRGQDLE